MIHSEILLEHNVEFGWRKTSVTCMTCFNHCRCNCGKSTFKFPLNLLHMHMPLCNLPREGVLRKGGQG